MAESGKISPAVGIGGVAAALVLGFTVSRVVRHRDHDTQPPQVVEASKPTLQVNYDLRYKIPVTDSQPQRGPADALVTVVEWCDLRGDVCRGADRAMTELLKEYEGRLRWVHRHMPDVRHPEQSRRMHEFARGAFQAKQDPETFWKVREQLLALPGEQPASDADMREIANVVGVNYDDIQQDATKRQFARNLAIDLLFTGKFGVREAPGFFVNGRPVKAPRPDALKQALKKVIDAELVAAQRLVDSGTQAKDVYEETIKDGLWSVGDDPEKRRAENAAKASEEAARRSQVTSDQLANGAPTAEQAPGVEQR